MRTRYPASPPALPPSSPLENRRRIRHERRNGSGLAARRAAGSRAGRPLERRQIEPDQRAGPAACRAHQRGAGQDAAGQLLPASRAAASARSISWIFRATDTRVAARSGPRVRRADAARVRVGWGWTRTPVATLPRLRCSSSTRGTRVSRAIAQAWAWLHDATAERRRRGDEDRQARARRTDPRAERTRIRV